MRQDEGWFRSRIADCEAALATTRAAAAEGTPPPWAATTAEAAAADEKERPRELLRPSWGPERTPLPEGWEEKVDPGSGRKYYANHRTRVKQWERPAAPAARQTTDWVRHFVGARTFYRNVGAGMSKAEKDATIRPHPPVMAVIVGERDETQSGGVEWFEHNWTRINGGAHAMTTTGGAEEQWTRHVCGGRGFYRRSGRDLKTGAPLSREQKDATIKLGHPLEAIPTKDEETEGSRGWFDHIWAKLTGERPPAPRGLPVAPTPAAPAQRRLRLGTLNTHAWRDCADPTTLAAQVSKHGPFDVLALQEVAWHPSSHRIESFRRSLDAFAEALGMWVSGARYADVGLL